MNITAADVNKLRQMTGAGMMDCKKALTEANGDFEAAVDILRKSGQKVAAKRADNATSEGLVLINISCNWLGKAYFLYPFIGTCTDNLMEFASPGTWKVFNSLPVAILKLFLTGVFVIS